MNSDKIIYKYIVPVEGLTLSMVNPKVVMVDVYQRSDNPIIWVESDMSSGQTDNKLIDFAFFGTGQRIPYGFVHVGSCHTDNGEFVWHVYSKQTESQNKEEKV